MSALCITRMRCRAQGDLLAMCTMCLIMMLPVMKRWSVTSRRVSQSSAARLRGEFENLLTAVYRYPNRHVRRTARSAIADLYSACSAGSQLSIWSDKGEDTAMSGGTYCR